MAIEKKISEVELLDQISYDVNVVAEQRGEWKRLNLKAGGDELGLVKNGGNVVIDSDGMMTAPSYESEGENSFATNETNIVLCDYSFASGINTISGGKGFKVLSRTGEIGGTGSYTLDSIVGLEIGDQYSIRLQNNYDYIGTIESISTDTNIITVTNYIDEEIDSSREVTLWIPEKPTIGTTKLGQGSHAEGYGTRALCYGSHAEGCNTEAGGRYSHAEGNSTKAGYQSHAEGYSTTASGEQSHAEGYETKAEGNNSHAEGFGTTASAHESHAEGVSTKALGYASHVQGKFNIIDTENKYAHIVGNGTDNDEMDEEGNVMVQHRSNAHTLDWDGNAEYKGDVIAYGCGGSFPISLKDVYDELQITTGKVSVSDIVDNLTTNATNKPLSAAQGVVLKSLADNKTGKVTTGTSYIVSDLNKTGSLINVTAKKSAEIANVNNEDTIKAAIGHYSSASGYNTIAQGNYSNAQNRGNLAFGENSHAEGYDTKAIGVNAHSEGFKTTTYGNNSHSEGGNSVAGRRGYYIEKFDTSNNCIYLTVDPSNKKYPELGTGTINTTFASPNIDCYYIYYDLEAGKIDDVNGEEYEVYPFDVYYYNAYDQQYSMANVYKHTLFVTSIENNKLTILDTPEWQTYDNYDSLAEDYYYMTGYFDGLPQGNATVTENAHAEGYNTQADGNATHVEGYNTRASMFAAHAEGHSSVASNSYAHAEGRGTTSSGQASHAEGGQTTASANYSHAEGNATTATGWASHAEGAGTIANGNAQHIEGRYNIKDPGSNYIHITGIGSGEDEYDESGVVTKVNRANAFTINRTTGEGSFAGGVASTGGDYAEYFEWNDGNQEIEDRVGYLVTLEGEKIKKANENDFVLGIVSGTAAVIGDNAEWEWKDRYLHDEFGRVLYEDVEENITEIDERENKETGEIEFEEVVVSTSIVKRPITNPAYNPSQVYVSRKDRPEWDIVGMLGKLYVRDDGTCQVNGYATVGDNGIATASSEKTNMRVLSRVDENVIRVLLK